ncbi:DNA-directed RNA polymerase II subunit rpb1 [Ceratobasidium sp. 395]|nr:DNA-directed RNA polymerase II subunit rpb1 [Ceratobasidium sp. 395]
MLFNMHLWSMLATQLVLEGLYLNRQAFDQIIGEIETKFNTLVANLGEICGTLAAQSIEESATQMTLNTSHYNVFSVVEKKTISTSQAGLIDIIFLKKGPEICRDLFSALQMVVNFWLLHNRFGIGIGDIIADKVTMSSLTNHIETVKNNLLKLVQQPEYAAFKWILE